jgi:hypothetical protein
MSNADARNRSIRPRHLLLIAGLLLLSGCGSRGPDLAPVSGTVALDGKPVAGAAVTFVPVQGGRPASAVADEQGRFQLTTFQSEDGAIVGKHTGTVALVKREGMQTDADGLSVPVAASEIREEWIVPKRYSSAATSGLSFQVEHGMEPLRIELKSEERATATSAN